MNKSIDYRKAVDVLDKGILALNEYKRTNIFDKDLKEDINSILEFFLLTKRPEYEDLLFDKGISINKAFLESIHLKMKEVDFPEDTIQKAISLLVEIGGKSRVSNDNVNLLEDYLFEISKPIWISLNFAN